MKLKYVLIAIVSLGLLGAWMIPASPAPAVSASENLAVNGDLEMGNTNGWEIASAAIDASVTYSGSYSLKLTATSAYSGAAFKSIPVRKNATVTVSFRYRYASDPGDKLYHVYTYQGADTTVGPYGSGADASFKAPTGCDSYATWQAASYSFNSGQYDHVYLKFCPGGSGGTPCYIDDLVVTTEGGDETDMDPYLTSFGTKMNRPKDAASNVIKNGGFESDADASWNVSTFLTGNLNVVADDTAPEGNRSLCLSYSGLSVPTRYLFPVAVEKYTQYTFSAWVKTPRLGDRNRATATFGVANAATGDFLVYEPYDGNGHGSASLSTEKMQLMATSPDGEWHLRSVTFYSGSHTTVNIVVYGTKSCLYLDDMALYKSSNGVEYISSLRTDTVEAASNGGNKYCADEDSLIEGIYMTDDRAQQTWSDNPAWRNGFLSFSATGDGHGTALKYTASDKTALRLHYIDWIDVQPDTSYTLTLDVKRLVKGDGRIALLDDDYDSPKEFYTINFSSVDGDWVTYSVTFTTRSYSRIGFAIVDGGGSALIDEVRLFETSRGIAQEPAEPVEPTPLLTPQNDGTNVMEMVGGETPVTNGTFEEGTLDGWTPYQQTVLSADAALNGGYGAHLKGNGTWDAMLEQKAIPVTDGGTYTLSLWYKANSEGANISLKGTVTGTQYAYVWANAGEWTHFTATFTAEGDTALLFNVCGGNTGTAEDVYLDNVYLIPADSTTKVGVAFRVSLEGSRIYMEEDHWVNLDSATVIPYADGNAYRLVRMGAVMTNRQGESAYAETLTLANVDGSHVLDIPVKYLMEADADGCTYAVRVVNIPLVHSADRIYARPYYVFEKDGEEIVVYGAIVSRSYDAPAGS